MKKLIPLISFIVIFSILFSAADRILSRKETDGWWNVTAKIDGFYNSPKNEYDAMFFGSSNTYCSFNPLVIWKETGVKSYVFATQQQPLWATYYYMKDALKRQSPKLCVVDVLMAAKNDEYYDDGVNYTFCDNMPLSVNKLKLVNASAEKGNRFGLICRFVKYHTRWEELTRQDFEYNKKNMSDYSKGYYVLTSACYDAVAPNISGVTEKKALNEKNTKYLKKIIELCNKNNTELIFVKAPSGCTTEEKEYYNSVKALAEENNISFIDYNEKYTDIKLDVKTDFFDANHLNAFGSEKFTAYFVSTVDFFRGKKCGDTDWEKEYNRYLGEKEKQISKK